MTMKKGSSSRTEHWSVADAKASLSRVLHDAEKRPQVIENRGTPVAVVVSFSEYTAALGDPDGGTMGWRSFLRKSAKLRENGGASLRVDRRTARRSPFDGES